MLKRSTISMLFMLGFISMEAQYISEVLEYRPAPGQFINDATWGVPYAMHSLAGGIDGHLSLGAFGGYVVFRFADAVENHPDNPYGVDFTIFGNPMPDWSEPAVVWVMADKNGNDLPDEQWYELAGSDYWFNSSRLARVSYENPGDAAADVSWEDELGNSGFIRTNSVHLQSYYPDSDSFPDVAVESYVLEGSLLEGRVDLHQPTMLKSLKRAFGYADNQSRGSGSDTLPDNPYTLKVENSGGDAFDINWAVDSSGEYVDLDEILFVKVQTGILHEGGYLGEISTEITGAVDIAPDPSSPGGADRLLVLADLPEETSGDTLQMEVFCFEKGRIAELPQLKWTISKDWARVDEEMRLIFQGEGEVQISVLAMGEPDLVDSTRTRVHEGGAILSERSLPGNEITFYPNPAQADRIWFSDRARVDIYTLSGTLVRSEEVSGRGGSIECGDLVSGVYIMLIKSDAASRSHKLIIQ